MPRPAGGGQEPEAAPASRADTLVFSDGGTAAARKSRRTSLHTRPAWAVGRFGRCRSHGWHHGADTDRRWTLPVSSPPALGSLGSAGGTGGAVSGFRRRPSVGRWLRAASDSPQYRSAHGPPAGAAAAGAAPDGTGPTSATARVPSRNDALVSALGWRRAPLSPPPSDPRAWLPTLLHHKVGFVGCSTGCETGGLAGVPHRHPIHVSHGRPGPGTPVSPLQWRHGIRDSPGLKI